MNEKDAENLRDIITEIEEVAGAEPIITRIDDLDDRIRLDIIITILKERNKTDD